MGKYFTYKCPYKITTNMLFIDPNMASVDGGPAYCRMDWYSDSDDLNSRVRRCDEHGCPLPGDHQLYYTNHKELLYVEESRL